MVMAWSVDRLGRSLKDLVAFLSELHALRIDLFLHQQGLDTRTPAGKAMFQMMGVSTWLRRHRVETARLALPLRPLTALGQEQESSGTSGQTRSRGRLGQREMNAPISNTPLRQGARVVRDNRATKARIVAE
jgi:hypothetical protein